MPTLTQLEYIVAVERHRHFRLAAKARHVTQPTLSMQIQKLEDELGVEIFDRSAKPVRPTAIGQRILDQSRVILSQVSLLTGLISEEKQSLEGDLRLAVIPTLAPYLLPRFVAEVASRFPRLRLSIEESKTEDIVAALRKNQLDLGLLVTPLGDELLVEHRLFDEPFYVYAAAGSELAQRREISDADLKGQRLLLLTEGHCMREQMLRICPRQRPKSGAGAEALAFESGSIETLCHLVEQGLGYTVIPHLARDYRDQRRGRIIPFDEPHPTREVSLVAHHSFARVTLLSEFTKLISDSLPSELRQPPRARQTRVPIG